MGREGGEGPTKGDRRLEQGNYMEELPVRQSEGQRRGNVMGKRELMTLKYCGKVE